MHTSLRRYYIIANSARHSANNLPGKLPAYLISSVKSARCSFLNPVAEAISYQIRAMLSLTVCLSISCIVFPVFAEKCNMIHVTATVWDMDCSDKPVLQLPDYHRDRPVVYFNGRNASLSSNITFKGWYKIRYIDLSFNELVTLRNHTFDGVNELEKLNLSYCSLHNITSSHLKGLTLFKVLDLSGNRLLASEDLFTVLNKSLHRGTETLFITDLGLDYLPNYIFSSARSLRRLYMRNNYLKELPSFPPRLHYLDISSNSYSVLGPEPFKLCSDLRTLVVQNNSELVDVDEDAFRYLVNLTILALDGNRKLEFLPNGVFFHNHHLSKLTLSGCGFKTMSIYFKPIFMDLTHLDLSGNPWQCSPSIKWLVTLDSTAIGNVMCDGDVALDKFYGDLKQTVLKHVIIVMVFATFLFFIIGLWFVYDLEKKRKAARPYWPLGKRSKNPLSSPVYVSTVM